MIRADNRGIAASSSLLVLLMWSVASCTTDLERQVSPCPDADGSAQTEMTDSAGVAIVMNPCVVTTREFGWQVDSVPDFTIGDDEDEEIGRLGGVALLPGGGVALVDQIAAELRYYDSLGALQARVGGHGAGPGEFSRPWLLPTPAVTGSLLVFDRPQLRFTTFPTSGPETLRSFRGTDPWLQRSPAPLGVLGHRLLVGYEVLDRRVVQAHGPNGLDYTLHWVDTITGRDVVLERFGSLARTYTLVRSGRPATGYRMPFANIPDAIVTASGPVVASGSEHEIREYDEEGALMRILRVDRPRRPVTVEAVAEEIPSGQDPSQVPAPDSMPTFLAVQRDPAGWTWANLFEYASDTEDRWVVFDPDGEARGVVRLPEGFRIHAIGDEFIVGSWSDDLDQIHVSRFRLDRAEALNIPVSQEVKGGQGDQ